MALEMRPACERCGAALAADGAGGDLLVRVHVLRACAEAMEHVCPNCGGELVARPRRVEP